MYTPLLPKEEKIEIVTKLSIREEVWGPVFGTLYLKGLYLSGGKRKTTVSKLKMSSEFSMWTKSKAHTLKPEHQKLRNI